MVEVALLAPWLIFLFLGIFNFGFYMYAGIAVANATRSAALELGRQLTSQVDQQLACDMIKDDLKFLPNFSSYGSTCASAPLIVVVGNSGAAVTDDYSGSSKPKALVTTTYQTIQLFPLPWLMGRMTLTRHAEVRVYE